ncbi:hypothetical protein KIL84_014278 [Mauremys mutica]|uniref:Uncharacterized protein n=1 Tax=Mauremys mutica TaxID=74926 RepID=A0A9D3XPW7_9SAUR|nr:hypothetical protein KIL84_014278 [Mauremys mutica]
MNPFQIYTHQIIILRLHNQLHMLSSPCSTTSLFPKTPQLDPCFPLHLPPCRPPEIHRSCGGPQRSLARLLNLKLYETKVTLMERASQSNSQQILMYFLNNSRAVFQLELINTERNA